MSSKKLFGVKNITSLIYGIIMLIPMFSILGRVIYVQSNKNAKDSYSVKQSTNTTLSNESVDSLDVNKVYQFTTSDNLIINGIYTFYYISEITMLSNTGGYTGITKIPLRFQFYSNQNGKFIHFEYTDNTHDYLSFANSNGVISTLIKFNFLSSRTTLSYDYTDNTKLVNFGTQTYLDNAFEYSLSTFTKDNNLGNVDMFGWFTDLFLDSSNPTNNLYIGFVNWYLNYALLVSSGYLMFLVLIWFINFVRRILDKSMYQDYGGF